MIVGLGTGSTVAFMLQKLSERIKSGLNISAVSTSQATTKLANSLGIKISNLADVDEIDITIDGADEVDENLNGIKGGGGALLHEKIIASNSKKNIWIVDSSKLVKTLGKFPLPIEAVKFGCTNLCIKLETNGFKPTIRMKGNTRFITDENNYIVDVWRVDIKGFSEEPFRQLCHVGHAEAVREQAVRAKHDARHARRVRHERGADRQRLRGASCARSRAGSRPSSGR